MTKTQADAIAPDDPAESPSAADAPRRVLWERPRHVEATLRPVRRPFNEGSIVMPIIPSRMTRS
jgi:hypothetical protein